MLTPRPLSSGRIALFCLVLSALTPALCSPVPAQDDTGFWPTLFAACKRLLTPNHQGAKPIRAPVGSPYYDSTMPLEGFPTNYQYSDDQIRRAEGEFVVLHRDFPTAKVTAIIRNQTLRFDIAILPWARRQGLYSKILERVLKDNPDTLYIPAQLAFDRGANAETFLNTFFETRNVVLEHQALQKLSGEAFVKEQTEAQVLAFRSMALESYYEMPAAKARVANGFGKLEKLVLNLPGKCIEFIATKGARASADRVPIFLVQSADRTLELLPNGQAIRVDRHIAEMIPDYVRTWEACAEDTKRVE